MYNHERDFRLLVIGFIFGLLCSLVILKITHPEMNGAIKHFNKEINCEQLKNARVVCYEVEN